MKAAAYKSYLLGVLLVILAFNSVDRLALGLVLQNVKTEFGLTDTQLGLLSGIAFAVFYSFMGLSIARWTDRGNRVTIITVTTALWCAAVALCGAAHTFVQLLAIRILVAVGEAGCIPTANSLIADYFPRAERPRAVARFMLGAPLSAVIGYFLAGWLNEFLGWRATFVLLGAPGLALAVLSGLTLKEPRVAFYESSHVAQSVRTATLRDVCGVLWNNRTFRHLIFCFSVTSFFGQGISKWQPTFFVRSYGLTTGELGTWFTVIYGLGSLIGIYLGGEWASRRAANNERLQLRTMALIYSSFGAVSACIYLTSDYHQAFVLMTLAAVGGATINAPLFATIQTLVPERMRATAIALIYLFANLIGMGLGPLAAGILSDSLRPWAGAESLRYALLALCPGYAWGGWHLWQASRTVTQDLTEATPQEESAHPWRTHDDCAAAGRIRLRT